MKSIFTTLLLTLLTLSAVTFSYAQAPAQKNIHHREQAWLGYFNQTRLTNKFGFWLDVHYRLTDNFVDRPYQFLFRPAVTYFIKDNLRFNLGYTLVENFPAKGLHTTRPEHRIWQQIWWSQKYTGLSTLQWLRLEERYNRKIANDVLQDGYNFTYRLRYNLSLFIPLKGKELAPKTPFVAVANELFINFGKKIVYNTFDQNRFFIGMGYQFNKHLNAQLGYLNVFQQDASGNNYTSSNAVRLFVFHNLDFRKKEDI